MLDVRRWRPRHTVLVLAAVAYFGVRFVEFAASIVFKDVKAALGVSTFVVGLAVAGSTVTYAAAQLPSGLLGDRFGHRAVVLGSLALTGCAAVLMAAAPSGAFIVLGLSLVGLVSGAYYSPATALLTDLFPEPGAAIGVHRVGAQVVGLTGPVVAVGAATYGWRGVLLASGLLTVPVLVGVVAFVTPDEPAAPEASLRDRITPSEAAELLSRPGLASTTVVAALAQFVDTASFSFLPLLLREYHGVGIETAGWLFTVYFVAVTAGQPAAGWLSDRTGRDAVTVGTLAVAMGGVLLLAAADSPVGIGAGVVGVGLGMGWGPPVQARVMDALDDGERGTGFGIVRSLYIGFAALNGVVVGGAVTLRGWDAGIAVILAALAGAILVLVGREGLARVRC